jgi:hypothetical protein
MRNLLLGCDWGSWRVEPVDAKKLVIESEPESADACIW